jgi:hypothetical protein
MLKKLDRVLGPAANILGSCLPKVQRKLHPLKLVIRPGGMGDLICADIALQELGLRAQDFLWLIEKRSRLWAEYRRLSFLCYDEHPQRVLEQIWRRHSLVINTEQLFGLAQGCALLAKAPSGHLACFETTRGACRAQIVVPYDWQDAHETLEFARLFAASLDLPQPARHRPPRSRLQPTAGPPLVVVAGCQSPSNLGTEDATFLSPPRQRTRHSRIGSRVASMALPHASRAIFLAYVRPLPRARKFSPWMEAPYTWPRFLACRPSPFSRVDVLENGRRLLRAAELFADMICPASHARNLGKSPPVQFNTNVWS